MNIISQEAKKRQAVVKTAIRKGKSEASRLYGGSLSSVKRWYKRHDGHVAEYGTHRELYADGGIYTEMCDRQAQFYRDNQSEDTNSDDALRI